MIPERTAADTLPAGERLSATRRWSQVSAIVDGALDLTPLARPAFLIEACGADLDLQAHASRLLIACEQATMFLADPAMEYAEPVMRALIEAPDTTGSDLSTALEAAVGQRYKIGRQLGRGGMALVYLARDHKHECRVAIKVMRPECAAPLAAERFLREVRITAGLVHPNILPVLDSGTANGLLYYVTPFVEGESLRSHLSRRVQLDIKEAVRLTREIAGALEYAHRRGIVHRDVKPDNILLADGHAVVADFGIARAMVVAAEGRISLPGVFLGSPSYMSPEQAGAGTRLDGRSDIYSLGCMLYEMLAGQPPFTGPSADSIIRQHLLVSAPPVEAIRDTVPSALAAVVSRALAKSPADRFAHMAELDEALCTSMEPANAHVRAGPGVAASSPRAVLRRAITAAVAPLFLFVAVLLFVPGDRITGKATRPSATMGQLTHVAVFPFSVPADSGVQYVSEAAMDLLSGAIDGVGNLRRVDPRELMGRVRQQAGSHEHPIGVDLAQMLSVGLGAERFVIGTASVTGTRIRLAASLHDVLRIDIPVATAEVEGELDDLAVLATALGRALFVNERARGGGVLMEIMALGAGNPAAMQAYLKGEAALRRGQHDSASVLLRKAVEEDSAFGLAWYRLGHAAGERAGRQIRH